jgi:surface polysaccharide O-acyltransferase-like enzyme
MMERERQYGLDILRIASMLGIIGLHILVNGEALWTANAALSSGFLSGMFVICSCSVNIFAMLTGYLYAQKPVVRYGNLIRLLLITVFYSALISVTVHIWKPEWFTVSWRDALFPVLAGRYWYIACYAVLFVLIPYLNSMIRGLSQRAFGILLLLLLVLLSVISTAMTSVDPFGVRSGYSPVWLTVCYLIGAYIRLYLKNHSNVKLWLLILAANIAGLTVAYFYFGAAVAPLMNYNSPVMVVNAGLSLLLFSRIRWKRTGKWILSLSASAFGVYIIHSHVLLYDSLIAGNAKWIGENGFVKCVVGFCGSVAGIYLLCWLAEVVRRLAFKWTRLDKLLERIGDWCDRIVQL